LAAIARRPEDVVVAPDLPALLARTQRTLGGALAVISGRTIASIDQMVDGSVRAVAGIHGLERRRADGVIFRQSGAASAALAKARAAVAEPAHRWPRAFIEHKGPAFALHYRLEPAAKDALTAAAEAAVAASGGVLKLIAGDCVLEVMLRGSDKGGAVLEYLAEPPFQGRRPVFVGDDVTDETAFRKVEELGGLAVIVGERRPTLAHCSLSSVDEVHRWIGALTDDWGAIAS
jgi:trehalose 6-phosphate phosphatase